MNKLLLIFILWLLGQSSFAQVLQPYQYFKHFTTKDGLASDQVYDIVEDKYGFLWVGTPLGLTRFDGKKFKTWPNITQSKLLIDGDYLWISGFYGILKMNLKTYAMEKFAKGYNGNTAIEIGEGFQLFKDSKNRLWLPTNNSGLYLFNIKANRFELFEAPEHAAIRKFDWIYKMLEDKQGNIYFGTLYGLVVIKADGAIETYPFPTFKNGKSKARCSIRMLLPKRDLVWLSIDDLGDLYFDLKNKVWLPISTSHQVSTTFAVELAIGKYLVGSTSHFLYDSYTHEFKDVSKQYEFMNNVLCAYKSKDGNIWLGSTVGLYRMMEKNIPIAHKVYKSELASSVLHYDSVSNDLYAMQVYGTSALIKWNLSTNSIATVKPAFNPKKMHVVNGFTKIRDSFYARTYNGIWKLDTWHRDPILLPEPKGEKKYCCTDVLSKYQDKILLTNIDNGPMLYNTRTGASNLLYQNCKNLSNTNPHNCFAYAACFDEQGNVYVLRSRSDTIAKLDENGKLISYYVLPVKYAADKIEQYNVKIAVDHKQNIWAFVRTLGLFKYEFQKNKWIQINKTGNFNMRNVEALLFDGDNTIWCSSQEGLYSINTTNNAYEKVDVNYNLESTSSSAYDVLPYKKGTVLATRGDGILYFLQQNKRPKQPAPYIYIEDLSIMGEQQHTPIDFTNKIVLKPNENSFSIKYGANFIASDDNIVYSVKLLGVDKDWQVASDVHQIAYSGISPGEYTLLVRASSLSNLFEPAERKIELIVEAAWYQTLWFKLLSILLLVGIIALAVRYYYTTQLAKQKAIADKQIALMKERSRIAADMHDDIGAGLSQIRFMSSEAVEKTDNTDLQEILKATKAKSDDLVDSMNDIIWSLSAKDVLLEDLLIYMKVNFSELIDSVKKQFEFISPEVIPNIELSYDKKRNIYLVCKEAIHNAIKHSNATHISLQWHYDGKSFLISIIDNGKGFDVNLKGKKGNGLQNLSKRMHAIGGFVALQSGKSGTKVEFKVPLQML